MAEERVSILGIGLGKAQYVVSQEKYTDFVLEAMKLKGSPIGDKVKHLATSCNISSRYFVVDESNKPREEWQHLPKNFSESTATMEARNKLYKIEAPKLAISACEAAIKDWGGDAAKEITHIISVSCTGVVAPGPEVMILKHFNLAPSTQRIGINLMGCFGGFRALSVAHDIVASSRNKTKKPVVLVVCTELCSLHFQVAMNFETFVSAALFGDGASAIIVGSPEHSASKAKSWWDIIRSQSLVVEKSEDQMTWEAGNTGFVMKLSQKIPESVKKNTPIFVESILKGSEEEQTNIVVQKDQVEWAIHPGGKAIIEGLEESLGLQKGIDTKSSWEVLDHYGNMSSATFYFVLDSLRNKRGKDVEADQQQVAKKKEYTVGLGFGPGLALEGVLLKVGERRVESPVAN